MEAIANKQNLGPGFKQKNKQGENMMFEEHIDAWTPEEIFLLLKGIPTVCHVVNFPCIFTLNHNIARRFAKLGFHWNSPSIETGMMSNQWDDGLSTLHFLF